MATSRLEQKNIETLWEASRRTYEQARRRENCTLWAQHHARLAGVFHARADHHARAKAHYEALLADMHTATDKGAA